MNKAGIRVYKRAKRDKSPAPITVSLIYAALSYAAHDLTGDTGPYAGPPSRQRQGSYTLPTMGVPMPPLTDEMRLAVVVAYKCARRAKCRAADAVQLIYDAIRYAAEYPAAGIADCPDLPRSARR